MLNHRQTESIESALKDSGNDFSVVICPLGTLPSGKFLFMSSQKLSVIL